MENNPVGQSGEKHLIKFCIQYPDSLLPWHKQQAGDSNIVCGRKLYSYRLNTGWCSRCSKLLNKKIIDETRYREAMFEE